MSYRTQGEHGEVAYPVIVFYLDVKSAVVYVDFSLLTVTDSKHTDTSHFLCDEEFSSKFMTYTKHILYIIDKYQHMHFFTFKPVLV